MSQEGDFAKALTAFAESTKNAIQHMGDAIEAQEKDLEMVAEVLSKISTWSNQAQVCLEQLVERIEELERKL